jgi:hypothetical protein
MEYTVSFMTEGRELLQSQQLTEHLRVMVDDGWTLLSTSHTVVGNMIEFYFFWSK